MTLRSILFRCTLAAFAIASYAVGQGARAKVAENPPGFHADVVIVSRDQLTKEYLTRHFLELLGQEPPPILSVWVFTSDSDAKDFWSGKITDHVPYGLWRQAYNLRNEKRWNLARFLSIRGAGLLSILKEDGSLETVALGKPDSTGLLSGSGDSRILHVNAAVEHTSPPRSHATFYIQTQDLLTLENGEKLMDKVGDLPFSEVFLDIRRDSWFLDSYEFPAYYPFARLATPPTREAYLNSPTMVCSRGPKPVSCAIFGKSGFDSTR